jgi:hypothetical protein
LAVDGQRNVYIAEYGNHRVRKVSPGGTITTFAGTGKQGFSGDGGPATSAQLYSPEAVAVDGQGNVYIADDYRVRKVSGGTITTIAAAASAQLNIDPIGVAVDGQGNLYIADYRNDRVYKVGASAAATLKLTLGGASPQRLLAQKGITITASCNKPCSLSATGSVRILGTRYVFGLTRATANLVAAGSTKLTLRFPVAAQARFRLLRKSGRQARAVITVKAADTSGHTTSATRTITVR